jgi:hypothetical protein
MKWRFPGKECKIAMHGRARISCMESGLVIPDAGKVMITKERVRHELGKIRVGWE